MPTEQQFQNAHQAWAEHFADQPDAPGGPNGTPLEDLNRQMACKNCGVAMDPAGWCVNCRWEPGLVPISQTSMGDGSVATTFVAEKRHKFIAVSILLTTLLSIIGVIGGIGNGDAGILVLSLIGVPAGIAAWKYTRLGRVWWGLPARRKMAALPAILFGGMCALFILPFTLFLIFVMWQVSERRF